MQAPEQSCVRILAARDLEQYRLAPVDQEGVKDLRVFQLGQDSVEYETGKFQNCLPSGASLRSVRKQAFSEPLDSFRLKSR